MFLFLCRAALLLSCLIRQGTSLSSSSSFIEQHTIQSITNQQDTVDTQSHHLIFPGGGIFFYWQAGFIDYLRRNKYDLSRSVSMTGASAGALCATLTATDVNFEKATLLALEMAEKERVWDRTGGLQGVWGDMIKDWLDELLPNDAATLAHQRNLSLLVTSVPLLSKNTISEFQSKDDLIACNMASVHLPWFLDGRLATNFRQQAVIDGSFFTNEKDYVATSTIKRKIILNHKLDPVYGEKNLLHAVEALSPDGIWAMMEDGRRFAKFQEEQGVFHTFPKLVS